MKNFLLFYFTLALFLSSCSERKEKQTRTQYPIIRYSSDAASLNPVSAQDELSIVISMLAFQSLTAIDLETKKSVGILASAPPKVSLTDKGEQKISYELRKNARFDNGRSITVEDVIFSIKLNICPLVNNVGGAYYYDFIKEVSYDSLSDKNFSFITTGHSFLNEFRSGDFAILPYEIYDPGRVLKNFSIAELLNNSSLSENKDIIKFAERFNLMAARSSASDLMGSGAYRVDSYTKEQRIILSKKEDWWGNEVKSANLFFRTPANKIQFEIINDPNTALTALKNNEINFYKSIPAELAEKTDSSIIGMEKVSLYGVTYIGFNMNHPHLKDKNIRKAISVAIPVEDIVSVIYRNNASPNHLPIPIGNRIYRNTDLKKIPYDLEQSKNYLKQAGWEDSDGDGTLEKLIDGEKQELQLDFNYNSGSEDRKQIGLILQSELKKIGINIELVSHEWSNYLDLLRKNELNMFINGFSSNSLPPEMSGFFHSNSANGGRNYASYKNPQVDSLLDKIQSETNEDKRIRLTKQLQQLIYEDLPYRFLLSRKEIIGYSKQLNSVPIYELRPNYWAPEIQ